MLHEEGNDMRHVTAREANQHFAKVLSAVERGEQVVISKRGKPVAVISPYETALTAERQAAIDHLKAVMDEPVELGAPFRTFTRDEMHER
jgi:prevent-host-death family protein